MSHRELTTIEARVFEPYGTLFDVAPAAKRCADALGGEADALATQWRTAPLEYTWVRSLMGKHADFWQVTRDALDYAMDAMNVSRDALAVWVNRSNGKMERLPARPVVQISRLDEVPALRGV